jgi:hypothetical protein
MLHLVCLPNLVFAMCREIVSWVQLTGFHLRYKVQPQNGVYHKIRAMDNVKKHN